MLKNVDLAKSHISVLTSVKMADCPPLGKEMFNVSHIIRNLSVIQNHFGYEGGISILPVPGQCLHCNLTELAYLLYSFKGMSVQHLIYLGIICIPFPAHLDPAISL